MKIIKTFLIIVFFSFSHVYADNKLEFEKWKNKFKSSSANKVEKENINIKNK